MSELELYKFLEDNDLEYHWENEGKELITWIPFYNLRDFVELLKGNYLTDNELMVNLQDYSIALDLVPIAEYYEIDLENILKKEHN